MQDDLRARTMAYGRIFPVENLPENRLYGRILIFEGI